MDITEKIKKLLIDTVVTADIAKNDAQGKVDVIGGDCPEGFRYCTRRKKCIPEDEFNEAKRDFKKEKWLSEFEKEVNKKNWKSSGNINWNDAIYMYNSGMKIEDAVKKYLKYSTNESIVRAAVVGSSQGRVQTDSKGEIEVLRRFPRPLRFSKLLGAYLPPDEEQEGEEEYD